MANLTGFKNDNKGAFIEKHPDANLQYGVNFTDYMATSDNISSATVSVETISGDSSPLGFPTDQATDVTVSGNQVNIRLSGGTSGNVYNVDTTIVTQNGDTDVRRFRIVVGPKHL